MTPYYNHDGITIYHGDCRDFQDLRAPLVLTDIPYGEVNRTTNGLRSFDKGTADLPTIRTSVIAELLHLWTTGSVYVFCGTEQVSQLRSAFVRAALSTRLCVWEKTNPAPTNGEHIWLSSVEACVFGKKPGATFTGFCASPVFRGPSRTETDHTTEKPRWLFEVLVQNSTEPVDTVLDPFMGSGTALHAAKNLGRRAIGIELEERNCEMAARRLDQQVLAL